MPRFDVSVIGELNLDLILYGLPPHLQLDREHLAQDLRLTLGSSSAIFAHNLACLGSRVAFSSSMGSDELGGICLQRLASSGLDVRGVRHFPGKTTGLTVILPQEKQRYILTYPGTMAEMSDKDLDLDYVFHARHLHVSSYFLQKALRPGLPEIFRRAKEAGLSTSLDTNDDPENVWTPDLAQLLPFVDILLPNEQEACALAGADSLDRAMDLLSRTVPLLVVKRGSRGSLAKKDGHTCEAPPLTVSVVDSVGAGDSFDAGFIHRFLAGASLEACLSFANVAGALSTTRAGGTEAFRDAEHREAFLRKHAVASPT